MKLNKLLRNLCWQFGCWHGYKHSDKRKGFDPEFARVRSGTLLNLLRCNLPQSRRQRRLVGDEIRDGIRCVMGK